MDQQGWQPGQVDEDRADELRRSVAAGHVIDDSLAETFGGERGVDCSSSAIEWCGSRLATHESLCARLGNSQDEQARNGRRAGADVPNGKVVVCDGEHGCIGEL